MTICIIGWYGTETLGDRSILIGLLEVFEEAFGTTSIKIGSLFPFFTNRSLFEDQEIKNSLVPYSQIEIFDSKDKHSIDESIISSDLIVVGGGPLIGIPELEIIRYSFERAKKHNKKTAILGCGIGPLVNNRYEKTIDEIMLNSDLSIMRDKYSYKKAIEAVGTEKRESLSYAFDPAILPLANWPRELDSAPSDTVVFNLREYPTFAMGAKSRTTEEEFKKLLTVLARSYEKVLLLPMHTFYIGGDDRYFLSHLVYGLEFCNIIVMHKPLGLKQLFDLIANANACIAMRYHAIVFQSLLNGNNYIIDYTNKDDGKIIEFVRMIGAMPYYEDRYFNMQSNMNNPRAELDSEAIVSILKSGRHNTIDSSIYVDTVKYYVQKIRSLMMSS